MTYSQYDDLFLFGKIYHNTINTLWRVNKIYYIHFLEKLILLLIHTP